jgi:hypothetical protein
MARCGLLGFLAIFGMSCPFSALADAPERKGLAGLEFSWDTLPRFLYISGTKKFTPEELDYIAQNFHIVTFAINFAVWKHDFPEYSYKLRPPKGPATKTGNVYTRDFAHASVHLDIEKREARITWK